MSDSTPIQYMYPIRPDLRAPIQLPADLTHHEAERLAAFIKTLVIEPATKSATHQNARGKEEG